MFLMSSADFYFKINLFDKLLQEDHQCQTVWIQNRLQILLGLSWVQTFCKGYKQMTQVGVKPKHLLILIIL